MRCCGIATRRTQKHFHCRACRSWYDVMGRKLGQAATLRKALEQRKFKGVDIDAIHKRRKG